ncbi:hypothetical protein RYF71_04320 [Wolbachia endosymbiont of Drosophila malagassya]|nr:hypothetical protein [Wolbachia endosymbiont of Drosophila malagassya]
MTHRQTVPQAPPRRQAHPMLRLRPGPSRSLPDQPRPADHPKPEKNLSSFSISLFCTPSPARTFGRLLAYLRVHMTQAVQMSIPRLLHPVVGQNTA